MIAIAAVIAALAFFGGLTLGRRIGYGDGYGMGQADGRLSALRDVGHRLHFGRWP